MTEQEAKEILLNTRRAYKHRLLLTDIYKYEMINLATMKFGDSLHCNTCGQGKKDIWDNMIRITNRWIDEL